MLTLSATVLAIIAPCLPTEGCANNRRQCVQVPDSHWNVCHAVLLDELARTVCREGLKRNVIYL